MKIIVVALVSATAVMPSVISAQTSAPIVAQPSLVSPIVAVARPSATDAQAALPANSEIWVSPNAEVNSKKIKQGEKFDMSVSRDVVLGNYVVIPRGTRAIGQISYRTGKGAFGKSAKLEFEVVDVDLGGRLIPVKGHYRIEGQGNTGAAVGAVVAVGVFGAFVTGHSATVAQGTEYKAYTTDAPANRHGGGTEIRHGQPSHASCSHRTSSGARRCTCRNGTRTGRGSAPRIDQGFDPDAALKLAKFVLLIWRGDCPLADY